MEKFLIKTLKILIIWIVSLTLAYILITVFNFNHFWSNLISLFIILFCVLTTIDIITKNSKKSYGKEI